MTPADYRKTIDQLGLSQRKAGRFLGVDERTSRRWANEGPIPVAVALLLRLMVRFKLKPADVHEPDPTVGADEA